MTTIKMIFRKLMAIAILALILPGCLDVYITTEVNRNGSIKKTVVLEGDSTEIISHYFPFINDESWEREWVATDNDKQKLILSKSFKSARKAAKELNPADSMPQIRIQPVLKRKFRWFFTYLDYSDIFLSTNPFQVLDWRDYLSENEVKLIPMDDDEREKSPLYSEVEYDSTETRFENYFMNDGYTDFFQFFMKAFKNTSSPGISAEAMSGMKTKILETLKVDNNDIQSSDDLLASFRSAIGSELVDRIEKENPDIFAFFDKKLDYFDKSMDDNYHFTLRMPGLLVNTNSNKIEGNNLSWDVEFFDAYFNDYEMNAESRVVNIWAFAVTGLAIAFLLFGLIIKLFKKKKD